MTVINSKSVIESFIFDFSQQLFLYPFGWSLSKLRGKLSFEGGKGDITGRCEFFYGPATFVIVQDLVFEVLRTAYNHIEKIRKFLSGIVKANVPEKFLGFYFVKMDAVRSTFQVTFKKFKEST